MSARETFTWLGLDPSLRAFGWALFVDDGEVHSCQLYKAGAWETERDEKFKRKKGEKKKPGIMKDNARRMLEIGEQLARLVQSEHPVAIFVESLAVPFQPAAKPGEKRKAATSLVTVQALGRVRGIVDGIALTLGVPVFEVGSQAIKLAMAGTRDAPKEEVGRRVLQLYPATRNFLPVGEIDDNVTDAVACGHIGESHEVIEAHRRRRRGECRAQPDLFDPFADDPLAKSVDAANLAVLAELDPAAVRVALAKDVTPGPPPPPKTMAEQLDEQLAKKRAAEETTEQRLKRMATPAVIRAQPVVVNTVPIVEKPRPPKGTRGKLTTAAPRDPKPPKLELPTPEQLANYWKADK